MLGGAETAAAWSGRIARLPLLLRVAAAILAGAVLALGHAPYHLPLLSLAGAPVLAWLIHGARSPAIGALIAWTAGIGYFGLSLTWIVEPFQVDAARHGWMAPFALGFLAAGLALFWAGAGWGAARIRGGIGTRVLVLAAGLAIFEYLRSTILTGFPWALYAYGWVDTPVAHVAALVGPHATGALLLLAGLAIAPLRVVPVLAAAAGLAGAWTWGEMRLARTDPVETGLTVRLVQPNAEQHLKWRADRMQEFYDRQISATSALPAQGQPRPDVVIWPETAVPFLLGQRPDLLAGISRASGGAPVILGLRRQGEAIGWRNTLATIGPGGRITAAYDKHHLVPFGEYMPLSGLMVRLGLEGIASGFVGGFQSGPGPARLTVEGLPPFQPLICYEAIFPHEVLRGPARPGWLVQITNDAWFGTRSGPFQHIAQAQFRAIEQGLPLARSANTGISAMIDPLGRVMAALPLGIAGHIDAPLAAPLPPTPYARYGEAGFLILLCALAAFVAAGVRQQGT